MLVPPPTSFQTESESKDMPDRVQRQSHITDWLGDATAPTLLGEEVALPLQLRASDTFVEGQKAHETLLQGILYLQRSHS